MSALGILIAAWIYIWFIFLYLGASFTWVYSTPHPPPGLKSSRTETIFSHMSSVGMLDASDQQAGHAESQEAWAARILSLQMVRDYICEKAWVLPTAVPRSKKRVHITFCQKVFLNMLSRNFHRKMILGSVYLVTLTAKAGLKW